MRTGRLSVGMRLVGLIVVVAAVSPLTHAQVVARDSEIARGKETAQFVCSACHTVAKEQQFPPILNQPAPSFFDIANRPGVTAQSLQHFITHTHWDPDKLPMTMPNPMLVPEQTRAVARYIMSLREH
jgi:mono/diheme cytochrome c family protein